jgi:hypothetical protein
LPKGAALPHILPDLIGEDTYDEVRDAYLRAAQVAEPDQHGSLLWLRWLVIKDTKRGCLRGVPAQIAEACRVTVLEDLMRGTREPLLPRVEARLRLHLASLGRKREGHENSAEDSLISDEGEDLGAGSSDES